MALEETDDIKEEVKAIQGVAAALETIGADTRSRVLEWAVRRYGLQVTRTSAGPSREAANGPQLPSTFETFAELHSAASPATEADDALVGGYWLQVIQGQPDFASQEVNNLLKNLGHAVGNITVAFNALKVKKPALVLQVQKSGTTKQARKKYKLTVAGIKEVEQMISHDREAE